MFAGDVVEATAAAIGDMLVGRRWHFGAGDGDGDLKMEATVSNLRSSSLGDEGDDERCLVLGPRT